VKIAYRFVQLHGQLSGFASAFSVGKTTQRQLESRRNRPMVGLANTRKRKLDPIVAFGNKAGIRPERSQRTGDGAAEHGVILSRERPLQRRSIVIELEFHRPEPRGL